MPPALLTMPVTESSTLREMMLLEELGLHRAAGGSVGPLRLKERMLSWLELRGSFGPRGSRLLVLMVKREGESRELNCHQVASKEEEAGSGSFCSSSCRVEGSPVKPAASRLR
jgi:hypothetical protein